MSNVEENIFKLILTRGLLKDYLREDVFSFPKNYYLIHVSLDGCRLDIFFVVICG